MSSNYSRIRHKRSSVEGKRPTSDILSAGELSINYNHKEPGVFITTSAETIAKIGPTYVGADAPNSTPPSGGHAFNSDGEMWFNDQSRVLRVFSETDQEWQAALSPLASSSKSVITVSQDSENATDALFNDGKVRPFRTLQRALLQVARETVQKDPNVTDPNYTILVSSGRYSVPNKGTTLGAPSVELSSVLYGDTSPALVQNGTTTITFTFSQEPALFDATMLKVSNGTITAPVKDPDIATLYTATFTRTDATYFGTVEVVEGAYTSLDGVAGLGSTLNLASSADQTTRVSLYEQPDTYEPTDADYEALNVNEGLIIPRGTTVIGIASRSVYVTGNYNSREAHRTPIFKVTGNSLIKDVTVIDKRDTGLVVQDDSAALLNHLRFADPHGLRTGDLISFERFGGARNYQPLVYGRSYSIVKVDDYTVSLTRGGSVVKLVTNTAVAEGGAVARYNVARDNLRLVNVHAWEFASQAELKGYYERVAADLFSPGTRLYTDPESWEATIVAPTDPLSVDSVRQAAVYFKDVTVRSQYGMSGWLFDGTKTAGLKSANLADCTLVSLQTDPDSWEVYNSATNSWGAPSGNTVDEKRQSIIDAPLNEVRVKVPRLANGQVDEDNDSRFFLVNARNNAYVSLFSCFAIGPSDHYVAESGGQLSLHSCVSNFGGVGLVAEGFSGIGTTGGALSQDTGWFVEGFLRPLKVDVSEAADNATEVNLGVAVAEVLTNTGANTDARLATDNIAVGETALYLDKTYSENIALPFSLVPSSAIYVFVPSAYYRAMLTANPFITDVDGKIVGFRTTTLNNAIVGLGANAIGEDLLIRRFVDPRTDNERNPQVLVQGKDQRPIPLNSIFRLTSGGKGTNGTQLVKSGVQLDPVLNNDPSHVFEVVDTTTRELGLNPNETLKSFSNIFAPTNEFFITVQQDGGFGAWDGGKSYVRGDIVSYNGRNYVASSPVTGNGSPDISPYWLNGQVAQSDISSLNTISSIGLDVTVINKDDGTRTMGITEDDLNPTHHPTQRAIRSFLTLLGVTTTDQNTILRPETRPNRLLTINDMLTAGMQVTTTGFASQLGTWPVEFNRPSVISGVSHEWNLCGYWNYSTALPLLQDSQLTSRESLDYAHAELSGGHVYAEGLTERSEHLFSAHYRDLYGGGLYDLRDSGGGGRTLFPTSSETTSPSIYYQDTAPSSPGYGTIWIDSSSTPDTFRFWDGGAWVTVGAMVSFNGRTGAVVAAEGDYTLGLLGDVTTTGASAGQVLKYDGTKWVPSADSDTIYTLPAASETTVGGAEVATQAETDAGTDDTRIVTPAKLDAYTANVLDARYSASGSGVLSFNGRSGAIVPTEGDYSLGQLSDVSTTGATVGQVLKWNGTSWVPQNDIDTDTITFTLDDLTDVVATGATSGQVLKFNGTTWVPATDSIATPTPSYGSFLSTVTQSQTVINTGIPVTLNTTTAVSGFNLVSGSRITATNAGVYNLQFSLQLMSSGGGGGDVEIWVDKNGTAVANSNTLFSIKNTNEAEFAALNFIETLAAGDYLELHWASTSTNVKLESLTSTAGGPSIPSAIVTIVPVGA